MVYCGKPSKGCQMCRTRRIKCDETKPTCNQCAKARRQCPGYKDEFDLVLRNENLAAKRRALKLTGHRRGSNSGGSSSSRTTKSSAHSPPISASTSSSSSSSSSSPPHSAADPADPSRDDDTSSPQQPHSSTLVSRRQHHSHHQQHRQPRQQEQQRQTLTPSPLHIAPEDLARCHFVANFVLVPRQDGSRGFLDYLFPLLEDHDGGGETHLRHAFNACALASLGNRTGSSSLSSSSSSLSGVGGGGGGGGSGGKGGSSSSSSSVLGLAFAEYSRALRTTQAALMDPERWRSDGVLAAVLLLGLFENITAKQLGNLAWGSHVQGAIQLVKARGRGQLRTKLGVQLFVAVRTQLIVHTLTTGSAPDMGAEWWIQDAVLDPTAASCQRLNLQAGELRADVTRAMATVTRTPDHTKLVQTLMRRAQSLDREVAAWMRDVPAAWRPRTLCWQPNTLAVPDYTRAEVFPGRVDVYSDFWVAAVWNQARAARLILMSIAVRCAAWGCAPVDYRTTPEYATAAKVCADTIADILASVPYHLGWHAKRRDLFAREQVQAAAFACGDDSGMKGLAGYFLTWPLMCLMTTDFATDAQRAYVKGRLECIADGLGIKYAHILSQLRMRLPSMLIRSDSLLASKPNRTPQDYLKMISSVRGAQQQQPGREQGGAAPNPTVVAEGARAMAQKWISV